MPRNRASLGLLPILLCLLLGGCARVSPPPRTAALVDPGIHLFGWTREQAERELGERFDLRAFHDTVLGTGAITLPMLRQKVESWIRLSRTRS